MLPVAESISAANGLFFADDVVLYYRNSSIERVTRVLNNEHSSVNGSLHKLQLPLAKEKCITITFTYPTVQSHTSHHQSSEHIPQVCKAPYTSRSQSRQMPNMKKSYHQSIIIKSLPFYQFCKSIVLP